MRDKLTDPAHAHGNTCGFARDHAERIILVILRTAGFPITYVDRANAEDGTVPPYAHYHHARPAPGLSAYVNLGTVARGDDGCGQVATTYRSNYRALTSANPGVFTPVSYTNVDVLGAFTADLTPALAWTLAGLVTGYPVYDEDDLAELEDHEIRESWSGYVHADIARAIRDTDPATAESWDALAEDQQEGIFWHVCGQLDIHPEHDGRNIHWTRHYPAIAAEITAWLTAVTAA